MTFTILKVTNLTDANLKVVFLNDKRPLILAALKSSLNLNLVLKEALLLGFLFTTYLILSKYLR